MSGDEVERILESYLGKKKEPVPSKKTGPSLPAVGKLTDELEGLLGRYLETTDRDDAGQPQAPSFALPRKPEIDEMLRRYHTDKDDDSASVLERSLRDYVESIAAAQAPSVPEQDDISESTISAAALHGEQSEDERFERYAQMLREAEEAEQELYAFQPDTETIQGMPRASVFPTPPKPKRKGSSGSS